MVNARSLRRSEAFFLRTVRSRHQKPEMALGFGSKADEVDTSNSPGETTHDEKVQDVEKQSIWTGAARLKKGRIGPPLEGAPAADSDAESSLDISKQMEMEASNAIKYRTCSWQKVRRLQSLS